MKASDKGKGSFEGAGLSVSQHPDAWRQIARGKVSGSTYRCVKKGNRFLSAHALKPAHRSAIEQWAVANGWATSGTRYQVSWYDDELDDDVSFVFDTREEAEVEAEDRDIEVEEVSGKMMGTAALAQRTRTNSSPALVDDLLLTVFVEDVLDIDGVWWQDRLDVQAYSAPRGVIVPSKVSSWSVEPA